MDEPGRNLAWDFGTEVIRRRNFTSVTDLQHKVLAFIAYFNRTMAKPFTWTYAGKPLQV